MKGKSFEKELPEGYRQVLHINAKDLKFGIVFNLIAMVILVLVPAVAAIPLIIEGSLPSENVLIVTAIMLVAVMLLVVVYMILHELVHGIAYKALTGEKLSFGLSWSCAFCGVPSIYTYRKTALIALVAPLTVFTAILLPMTVLLYFVHPYLYIGAAVLLGYHLGGCSGDAYVTMLFLLKYKDKRTLMRDTGPEQYIYLPLEKGD